MTCLPVCGHRGGMDIAMIGAGTVGRALTSSIVRAGHVVLVSDVDAETAKGAADATGASTAASNRAAVDAAQVVVLAVYRDAVDAILGDLGSAIDGKIVIDVTNRMEPEQLDGTSNAEATQARVPAAHVVKAFNTALAARQADPFVDGVQLDGFVAGDDERAKLTVLDLVSSMGFRPIDAGGLIMARALEAMAMLNIRLNMSNGWPWQDGWKLVGPTS